MTGLSLQFHADRIEILTILCDWARRQELLLITEVFDEIYQARLVDEADDIATLSASADRISLSLNPVELDVSTSLEYVRQNPDVLTILLGDQTDESLRESFLSAGTNDAPSLAQWKRLRNSLRRSMLKGAWVEDPWTGARQRKDSHPYTRGAKRLQEDGVSILALAGHVRFLLD